MSNQLKLPIGRSLNQLSEKVVNDAAVKSGQSWPCHAVAVNGAIITVAFDIDSPYTLPAIDIPLAGAEYIRYPIQPGDKGIAIACDVDIAPQAGLGTGIPNLSSPAPLGALVFLPIGNKNWNPVDPNAVVIYAPNGVVIEDTAKACSITVTPDSITAKKGSYTVVIDNTGISMTAPTVTINGNLQLNGGMTGTSGANFSGNIVTSGDVVASGKSLSSHEHNVVGVQTGGSTVTTTPPN